MFSCWRNQSTTLKPSPSGSPISSTSRCGCEGRAGFDGFLERVRRLHGDTLAGKHLADHLRQVAIVLDDEDARLVARPAEHARQLGRAAHLPGAAWHPAFRAPGQRLRALADPPRSTGPPACARPNPGAAAGARIAHPFMPSSEVSTRMAWAPWRAAVSVCSTVAVCTTE